MNYVLHLAALGCVPRSIKEPVTTNNVNISGFLNMLVTALDGKIKRFVYAASSKEINENRDPSSFTPNSTRRHEAVVLGVARKQFLEMDLTPLKKEVSMVYNVKGVLKKCDVNAKF